jgi:hypothetical protein
MAKSCAGRFLLRQRAGSPRQGVEQRAAGGEERFFEDSGADETQYARSTLNRVKWVCEVIGMHRSATTRPLVSTLA